MKRLVNSLKFYLRLYQFLVKFSVMDILIFRTNALVMGLAPIFWMATMIVFLLTIFSGVKQLGGWNFWETVFLTGVHEVIFLLTWATVITNLRGFIDSVRTGKLDQVLLKPINPRFLVSFRSLDFTVIGSFFNVIFVFVFSLGKIWSNIEAGRVLGFILFIFLSYWMAYFIYFIFASLSLFFLNARTLLDWVFDTTDFDRYPADIYPPSVKIFFSFFLPVLFFAYFPTAFLLGKISAVYIIYALMVLVGLLVISHFVWHHGLKNYQSASN